MTDRAALEPVFVLHRRPWGNTSLIVELLSRHYGRLGAVVRGARRGRSPRSALLQPFHPLLTSWSGHGDLATLGTVEAAGRGLGLAGEASLMGLYLNELTVRLTHRHDPHEALFDDYLAALAALAEEPGEAPLRRYEYRLLVHLGYAPPLTVEADTGADVQPGVDYWYHPGQGPRRAAGSGPRVPGAALRALAADDLEDADQLRALKPLMRALLAEHLGDRPLASRELFRRRPSPGDGQSGEGE
ncbi:MAG: DNA repair protein RecO [Pseudomonadota bacterium]